MIGNIGLSEIIAILIIFLIFFGPEKIPEIGRTFGKLLKELKRMEWEFEGKIKETLYKEEIEEEKNDGGEKDQN